MPRLAFMTFGLLEEPRPADRNRSFLERGGRVFASVTGRPGYIDHASRDPQTGQETWGEYADPTWLDPELSGCVARTLSLWEDLESVRAFAYAGEHSQAMKQRRDWFRERQWPEYAAWWVGDDHTPDWGEAMARHQSLLDHGPTSFAFDFRTPFGPDGQPATIDHARVKARMGIGGESGGVL